MKRELHFWVLGGDRRQVKLARQLTEDGHWVQTCAMELREREEKLTGSDTLQGIEWADCVILPLPAVQEDGILNAPLSDRRIPATDILAAMRPGQLLCGGKLPESFCRLAEEKGIVIRDYFAREELAIANGVPTAEGAIQIAMEELQTTIYDCRVLVIGYGRLGKLLAQRLKGLGARVTVSARNYADLAWIQASGYLPEHTDQLDGWLGGYGLIVNTVPTMVLDGARLADIDPECLVIDLASKPGGVDYEAATRLGVKVIHALSLPGKVAPETSGKIICNTIYHMIQEMAL
jgi:dipicolinate synthase subunit A